ncbi:hypothetical protein LshimejAT787_0402090 [Lyophyllum shimeji]|uniref:Secreted protein n=1 Tax=Lyophyllum shimeji TaxID=47721 RepID=A0A9P3PKJ1_LYOSH|nr:hypothetical protein LshimejAT787_0402090 [Lyophyllum shimeji]
MQQRSCVGGTFRSLVLLLTPYRASAGIYPTIKTGSSQPAGCGRGRISIGIPNSQRGGRRRLGDVPVNDACRVCAAASSDGLLCDLRLYTGTRTSKSFMKSYCSNAKIS